MVGAAVISAIESDEASASRAPPPPGQWVAEPGAPSGVNLLFGNQGMEAFMAFVRLQSSHHRRRLPRPSVVLLGLGVWLVLGLISQAAFRLIG